MNKEMRDFAELLVSWCMRDIEAGLVKTKPQTDESEALPQSKNKRETSNG